MARLKPQIKYTVPVSEQMDKALAKVIAKRKLSRSEAVREALAQWLGRPELAEMAPVGAPRKDKDAG